MDNIVSKEIFEALQDVEFKGEEKKLLSLRLIFIVFDTQRAIFDLVKLGHLGAASTLLRVLFEASVKAEWLYLCASDKQIQQFKKDNIKSTKNAKYPIKFQEMIDDIETKKPHLNGNLSKFKKYHWKGLNSFTHSGVMQLNNSLMFTIEQEESIAETALEFSERFAISSLGLIGEMFCNVKVLEAYLELAQSRLGLSVQTI